jgi:hypothetical protein
VNERSLANSTAPLGRSAALAGGIDLPFVDERHEVLTHTDHIRVHPDLAIPSSDGGRAIGMQHQAGGSVHERPCGVALAEVTAVAGTAEAEAAVEHGDDGSLLSCSKGRRSQWGTTWVLKTGV